MSKSNQVIVQEEITKIIDDYNAHDNHPPQEILNMAKNLASRIFYMEKHRAAAHKDFEAVIYELKRKGIAINNATNEANIRVPEMYELRRFMESAKGVLEIMRSQVSWLKTEMQHTNISG